MERLLESHWLTQTAFYGCVDLRSTPQAIKKKKKKVYTSQNDTSDTSEKGADQPVAGRAPNFGS